MVKLSPKEELAALHRMLMPVLSKAAIGDFSGEVDIDPASSQQVNEILMGVEVLLEAIREKIAELEAAGAGDGIARSTSTAFLDEVLREPAE